MVVLTMIVALLAGSAAADSGDIGGTDATGGFALMEPLTASILAHLEQKFALKGKGDNTILTGVPCAKRTTDGPSSGRCVGGDRMKAGDREGAHAYGPCYERVLNTMRPAWARSGDPATIMEVGILSGSGLAIWDSIFAPTGRVSVVCGVWWCGGHPMEPTILIIHVIRF